MKGRRPAQWFLLAAAVTTLFAIDTPWHVADTEKRDGLTFASGALLSDLDQPGGALETRIVQDYQHARGQSCRAFLNPRISGIACRRGGGWHLVVTRDGIAVSDPTTSARIERNLRRALIKEAAQ